MFCSTVIPTIGRSTLSQAVCSVLNQAFTADDFEVIVVNDSGQPLPQLDWQHSEQVRVVDTNRRERSVARNTGAAIARGRYLHFLDDDDLLLPGALDAFWRLDQSSDAAWLCGSYQSVDNDGNLIHEFHPDVGGNIFSLLVAGEAIPFQASLLQAEQFFAVGAYDPQITGVEDRDLGRRMALRCTVAKTPAVVARIRVGEEGSSTNWSTLAEGDRWGREKALREQGALARLWASAKSSYFHGRVSRALFASMVWNLRAKNMFTAASRATLGVAFAGWYAFSPGFWRGMGTQVSLESALRAGVGDTCDEHETDQDSH
jgi:glycosyltransferase involved in cell wall biosynthesis